MVRAVVASKVPVISGVGHETDFTLCDFAADLRAPTPTAAAELATPVTVNDLLAFLQGMKTRIASSTLNLLAAQQFGLESLMARLRFVSPVRSIQTDRQRLDDLSWRGQSALRHRILLEDERIKSFERRLESLNPLGVLKRGYAIVSRKSDGVLVHKTEQIKPDDEILIRVSDGQFDAVVSKDKES